MPELGNLMASGPEMVRDCLEKGSEQNPIGAARLFHYQTSVLENVNI